MRITLETNALTVADMLDHDQETVARPHLEEWTGVAISTEMFARLRLRYAHARQLLALLAEFRPPEVKALLHVLHARQSGAPFSPGGAGSDITANAIRQRKVTVDGDHYSILKAPYVQQLSQSIVELIATTVEIEP